SAASICSFLFVEPFWFLESTRGGAVCPFCVFELALLDCSVDRDCFGTDAALLLEPLGDALGVTLLGSSGDVPVPVAVDLGRSLVELPDSTVGFSFALLACASQDSAWLTFLLIDLVCAADISEIVEPSRRSARLTISSARVSARRSCRFRIRSSSALSLRSASARVSFTPRNPRPI